MAGVPGLTKKVPAPVSKNNQLGGTGPDADKGKGRTQFEDDRRKGNQGGKDRPPVYKPNDDGERGGYKNRSVPAQSKVPGANEPYRQNQKYKPSPSYQVPGSKANEPLPKNPSLSPAARAIKGSSAVHGMIPRY